MEKIQIVNKDTRKPQEMLGISEERSKLLINHANTALILYQQNKIRSVECCVMACELCESPAEVLLVSVNIGKKLAEIEMEAEEDDGIPESVKSLVELLGGVAVRIPEFERGSREPYSRQKGIKELQERLKKLRDSFREKYMEKDEEENKQ